MNVKKFEAATFEEALLLVKNEMGPDALILSTEEVHRGIFKKASVEITAAVEKKNDPQPWDAASLERVFPHRRRTAVAEAAPAPKAAAPARAPKPAPSVPGLQPSDTEWDLLRMGLSPETARDFARQIVFEYPKRDTENPQMLEKVKTRLLTGQMRTLTPDIFASRRSWAVVGGAGAGKTSFIVKLALTLRGRQVPVRLASCDQRKVLGRQELAAYARLIDVPFHAALVAEKRSGVFLLDTPSTDRAGDLFQKIEAACRDLSTLVVLDASQRLEELLRAVERFDRLAPVALAFTRLDAVGSAGVIYDVLRTTKLPLLACSMGPELSQGVSFFEPADLAVYIARKPQAREQRKNLIESGASHGSEALV